MKRSGAAAAVVATALLGTGLLPVSAAGAEDEPIARVLVFSETAGFRHVGGINAGRAALQALGAAHGFEVDLTENSADFTDASLARYDAVIWLSTTGDVLNGDEQAAFQRYIRGGGGFVGIHSASDTHPTWEWYGGLVGAYFVNHPAQQAASLVVSDLVHPSTAALPTIWPRFDEWYNFNLNPRGDVHVLLSIDERSYNPGTGAMGADHPLSWCQVYDGGRSWYTALGHGASAFDEPLFRQHILGGIQWATGMVGGNCGGTVWDNYRKTVLDAGARLPSDIAVAPDGRVFYLELGLDRRQPTTLGNVKVIDPATQTTTIVDTVDVYTGQPTGSNQEDGLLGIALDPNFAENSWLYLYYSPVDASVIRLSRFTLTEAGLTDERAILEVSTQRNECCHTGGSLVFDPEGNLYITTGDNTNPFESSGYAPIDERPGRSAFDAQGTSANTNDLRGKVLRIKPTAEGGYTIPDGNLFATGTPLTRPEIYAMGFRNPYRADIDAETGKLVVADYGPDAGAANPLRGPEGRVEWNIVDEPGNYGWPYCHGGGVYVDFDFATSASGAPFDCNNPVNTSPNNTGFTNLPPVIDPEVWYGRGSASNVRGIPPGGGPMAGPVYRYDADLDSDTKWPEYFDGQPFFYEWTSRQLFTFTLDGSTVAKVDRLLPTLYPTGLPGNPRPHDMTFGPDGAMYIIDWGHGFGTGGTSAIARIDWIGGPTCVATDVGTRTVVVGGIESGVPNRVTGNGCSINQLIRDDLAWPSHGLFMAHVNEVTDYLVGLGALTDLEEGRVISAAARSSVGQG